MLSWKTRRYRIEENKIRMLSYKIFHYDIKEESMYFYIACMDEDMHFALEVEILRFQNKRVRCEESLFYINITEWE